MNQDFYPTPKALISKMLSGVELESVETVLEPSAGKGDVCDYIAKQVEYRHRKPSIDVIEIEPDLQAALRGKKYNLIHDDFLTFDTHKVYELIVANFPFSEGDQHLQKALSLIEKNGGNLVCLVNAETIRNPHTNLRQAVVNKLEKLGASVEYLPGEFVKAERSTDVEVALIRVSAERASGVSLILDSLQKSQDVAAEETIKNELIEKDFIKALITRFDLECKLGIRLIEEYFALKPYITDRIKRKSEDHDYSHDLIKLEIEGAYDTQASHVNAYLSGLRHKYWELLLNDKRFTATYTSNILGELQSKLNELRNCDFTLFNVRELQKEMEKKVVQGIESSILKLFEEMSGKYAWHEEIDNGNAHYYNGWKTNKAYKIHKKVIMPINGFSAYFKKDRLDGWNFREKLEDIVKVFNYLSDEPTDVQMLVGNTIREANAAFDFSGMNLRYFDLTVYKKGTCHLKFKDERLLEKFNIFGSQRKGWLPPSYGKKSYRDMSEEEQRVVQDFQGEEAYQQVMQQPDYFLVNTSALALGDGLAA